MDIVKEIESLIICLDGKQNQIDFDHLRSVLAEAREAVISGLNRSQQADLYDDVKRKLTVVQNNLKTSNSRLKELEETISSAHDELSKYKDYSEQFRSEIIGKINLIQPDTMLRDKLIDEVNAATKFTELLKIKYSIDNLFSLKFNFKGKTIKTNTGNKINTSLVKLGGN